MRLTIRSILLTVTALHLTGADARLSPRERNFILHPRHDEPSSTASLVAVPTATSHHHGHVHHQHSHHGKPLSKLNETDLETQHGPRLQSYMRHDLGLPVPKPVLKENLNEWQSLHDSLDQDHPSHRGLMFLHIGLMMVAFFAALPICFILRGAKHRSHHAAFIVFLATSVSGWFAGVTYRLKTPDLYEGAVHGTHGTLFMIFILSLCALDHLRYLQKAYQRLQQRIYGDKPHYRLAQDRSEKVGILSGTIATEASKWPTWRRPTKERGSSDISSRDLPVEDDARSQTRESFMIERLSGDCVRTEEYSSDGPYQQRNWQSTVRQSLVWLHNLFFRVIVVLMAYGMFVTGAVTYIGYGHDDEAVTVIGHLVPASLLIIWGLAGFLRYTGNFARGGWAWPGCETVRTGPSLEMFSCLSLLVYAVITLCFEFAVYNSSDPRQTQHLGMHIVVFCSSAIGILLESKTIQRFSHNHNLDSSDVEKERTRTLNPCSAITTALGGLVFLQHPQPYVFAVAMHKLAGAALLTSAVCRFATCALSWIGASGAADGRRSNYPPTELLASLALTTGGFTFMFSSEEASYDAMRLGFDDAAIFMCVAAALTSFLFFWLLFLKTIGAWALAHRRRLDL